MLIKNENFSERALSLTTNEEMYFSKNQIEEYLSKILGLVEIRDY